MSGLGFGMGITGTSRNGRIMQKAVVIDDDRNVREMIRCFLLRLGFDVALAADGDEGFALVTSIQPDIVILDIQLPGKSGFEVLRDITRAERAPAVIMVTGYSQMEFAIRAVQLGAFDYLEKPIDRLRLQQVIERALEQKRLSACTERNVPAGTVKGSIFGLIGNSNAMNRIYTRIGQVSNNRVTALILGESGTGKELVARVIHESGVTKGLPFVAVNCSAIPEGLIESEFFGHMRGSFTGAIRDKKGKFELASEGTIFLDEISELSLHLQAKLLRVLQERQFEPVGSEKSYPLRARVVAACNQDLFELVQQKRFREDLFYRLNVFRIDIPPLRERKDDIPLLIMHFLRKMNGDLQKSVLKVPYRVVEVLRSYNWPGNVRELENTILRAVLTSKADVLDADDIVFQQKVVPFASVISGGEAKLSLQEVEKRHIRCVLENVHWNKQAASAVLGITKPTLYSKIREYALNPDCIEQPRGVM